MATETREYSVQELETIMDWLTERDHDCYLEMRGTETNPKKFDKIQKRRMHLSKLSGVASHQRLQRIYPELYPRDAALKDGGS